ncbi:MAG: metal-dependent hydrolase, partial [Gemmatimonadota bacterium]|nr:metal-dependent hydrolase [Gemmatimonadota bacterium]
MAGAALAESGLKHRTALGAAALLIGANLPDIDVLSYLGGPNFPLAFRRGWTHGVLALVLLPPLLTAALVGFDRLAERMRSAVLPTSVRPRELLLLSYIAVWSHPVLDTLNVYGVRWLMPFAERWFYGDVLFIVDPWLTLVLAAGVWVSRRRARARHVFRTAQEQPARLALGVVVAYIALMTLASVAGSRIASRELTSITGETTTRVMLAPVPVNPFSRRVVAEQEQDYLVAGFRWLASPHIERTSVRRLPRGPWSSDAVQAASR